MSANIRGIEGQIVRLQQKCKQDFPKPITTYGLVNRSAFHQRKLQSNPTHENLALLNAERAVSAIARQFAVKIVPKVPE